MKGDKTLSVFVDESGRFKYPDPESHYYIVGLVFHDQTFAAAVPCPVEFAQGVKPGNYKLFQLADLICTLHLLELKIRNGEPMTLSEFKFFGSPRTFERNVLRKIKPKEI